MTDRELMQQAFDAMSYGNTDEREAVRVALRDRLAQPDQEPVAWLERGKLTAIRGDAITYNNVALPLYTATPQRKPLTDEQIDKIYETKVWDARRSFARAIEAAHGIKEES